MGVKHLNEMILPLQVQFCARPVIKTILQSGLNKFAIGWLGHPAAVSNIRRTGDRKSGNRVLRRKSTKRLLGEKSAKCLLGRRCARRLLAGQFSKCLLGGKFAMILLFLGGITFSVTAVIITTQVLPNDIVSWGVRIITDNIFAVLAIWMYFVLFAVLRRVTVLVDLRFGFSEIYVKLLQKSNKADSSAIGAEPTGCSKAQSVSLDSFYIFSFEKWLFCLGGQV